MTRITQVLVLIKVSSNVIKSIASTTIDKINKKKPINLKFKVVNKNNLDKIVNGNLKIKKKFGFVNFRGQPVNTALHYNSS